nr:PorT family protein [Bacteroidota bacterium]
QTNSNKLQRHDAIASQQHEKSKSESVYNNKVPFNGPVKDKVSATTIASDHNTVKQPEDPQNPLFKDKTKTVDLKETGVASSEEQQNTTDKDPSQNIKDGNHPIIKDITEVGISNTTENIVTDGQKAVQEEKKEEDKPSIFDAIVEAEETEDKKEDIKDADLRSWEVTPNFGPVFYSSLDGGSSIDPMFTDNSQSTETNFSYGVQVSYAVNDRLSIRSGVSNVNLGYTTGDIDLATGPVSAALTSIDYGGRSNVLTAVDKGALETTNGANPFDNLSPKSTGGNNAQLSQNLTYYEVPLELNYALVDNRFGINMIGGFSTLFLGDSEVVANDGDFREVLGESNNLNSVSFSTNVGLGFNYKISKRLKFNIEPMFKYQLNPYSDSSVDFKPYYLGVYSGLSFKF